MNEQRHASKIPKFLKSLYEICTEEGFADIIQWDEVNQSFIILDLNEFAARVLPSYFSHSNTASFIRQLNNYGFTKVTRGDGLLQYFNKYFVVGKWDLLYKLARSSSAKKQDDGLELSGNSGHLMVNELHSHSVDKACHACATCKHFPNQISQLENKVNFLMNEVRELKMVNEALKGYICAQKAKESYDKTEFNPEELLMVGSKRKKRRARISSYNNSLGQQKGGTNGGYYGDGGPVDDNSSDSGGSFHEIYSEKDFHKKFTLKKPNFDFEGF